MQRADYVAPFPFTDLPSELLINIFMKCDIQSLGRLSQTCKLFRQVIKHETHIWRRHVVQAIITNEVSEPMRHRCVQRLNPRERLIISHNWLTGLPGRKGRVRFKRRYMPSIHMDSKNLWYTMGNELICCDRSPCGAIDGVKTTVVRHRNDITRFLILSSHVVTGGSDNKICVWEQNMYKKVFESGGNHSEVTSMCSLNECLIISAFRDRTVKVFNEFPRLTLANILVVEDHIWDVAIMNEKSLIVGCGAWDPPAIHPLQLYDIESGTAISEFGPNPRKGAGILRLCVESHNEIYSGSYDSEVRLWDIRDPRQSVSHWDDPYDNSIVSLATDHHNTFFSGSNRHGVVCIYDKRTRIAGRVLYTGTSNSPVYSLTFDSTTLFTALDRGIFFLSYQV